MFANLTSLHVRTTLSMHFLQGMQVVFSLLFLSLFSPLKAQINADSLREVLQGNMPDTVKIASRLELAWHYNETGEYDKALKEADLAYQAAKRIYKVSSISSALNVMGNVHHNQGDYHDAIRYYSVSLKLDSLSGDSSALAASYNNLGNTYSEKSDYATALRYYLESLKINTALNDQTGKSYCYLNIGNLFWDQDDYEKALGYFHQALEIDRALGDELGMASEFHNIAGVHMDMGDYAEAINYHKLSHKIRLKFNYKPWLTYSLFGMGEVLLNLYEDSPEKHREFVELTGFPKAALQDKKLFLDSAYYYIKQCLETEKAIGDLFGMTFSLNALGDIMRFRGDPDQAIRFYNEAAHVATTIQAKERQQQATHNLYLAYKAKGDEIKALEWFEKTIAVKDSIFNEGKQKEFGKQEARLENEKIQAIRQARHESELAVLDEQRKRQKLLTWSVAAILGLMVVFFILLTKRLRLTKKQKEIIESQKKLVEVKNREVVDSINYAKRLQDAILPSEFLVSRYFRDSFICYFPKDIVAGDFYWLEQSGPLTLFAVGDCTGHGVPGALVSVVCSNALNRAVFEFHITDPGKILDKVRDLVMETFEKSAMGVKDGMDISLGILDNASGALLWAGANNPLWLCRDEQLIEIKADKQPVGSHAIRKPFTTHTIDVQQGDMLYLFTDGMSDQFGGKEGKKYKSVRLKQFLARISTAKGMDQKKLITDEFVGWKGDLEQVDDICIMGVRI